MSGPPEELASLQERLPAGVRLPPEFAGFVELVSGGQGRPVMDVQWSDPCPLLNADDAARDAFVPFLLLGDGGVVAWWLDGAEQRVAYCDSEGQFGVLARDFSDFLALLAQADSPLIERLELEAPLDTSGLVTARIPAPVPAGVQDTFNQWVEDHSLSAPVTRSPAGEAVRSALHALAARMLQNGLSKVYKPQSLRWSFQLRLAEKGGGWSVEYLDYGAWYQLPNEYGFDALLPQLLSLMKTRASSYELSIQRDGTVFGDGGNQLHLPAPDAERD